MTGKTLIIVGLAIAAVGVIFSLAPKAPLLGRLPGDIFYRKGNFTFYFPVATSILVSVIASIILYFMTRR